MPAPITVHFATAGTKEVDAAFKTIMDRVRQLNQVEQQVGASRERAATKSAKAMEASNDKAAKAAAAASERAAKAAEKAAEREKKAAERKGEAVARAAKKAADTTEREAKRAADAEAREAKRAGERKQREAERAAKAAAKAVEREAKRAADAETREAKRAADARLREARRAAEQANQAARSRAAGASGILGRAASGTLSTATGIAAGLGATVGTYAIGQSLFANMAIQERARLLVNATRDDKGKETQSTQGLTEEAQRLAGKYGMESGDVMGAMETVAARAGGAKGLTDFRQDMEDLAKTAKAYGVNMADMGSVAAAALNAGVHPGEEMRKLITDLVAMGKDGSVEFKDLASELAKLAGAGLTFGSGADMIRRSVGMAQIAVRQQVSPEEARTSVKDFFRDVNTKAQDLKHSGVKVYGDDQKQRDPAQILADTIEAAYSGKGIWGGKGKGYLKGTEGVAHVFSGTSLAIASAAGEEYQKGGGKQAILDMFDKASSSQLAPGERDKSLANMMAAPSTQFAQARANFEAEIGKLLPRLQALLPTIVELTEKFAKLAVWVGENPFAGLGLLFGGLLAKEIAAAGLSGVLRSAVTAALGGTVEKGIGSTVGGAIGGLLGPNAAAGAALRTAVPLSARGILGMGAAAGGAVLTAGAAGFAAGWYGGGAVYDWRSNVGANEGGGARSALINQEVELERLRKEASRGKLSPESQTRLQELVKSSGEWSSKAHEGESVKWYNTLNPFAHMEASSFKQSAGENAAESFDKVKAGALELAKSMGTLNDAIASIQPADKSNPGDASRNGRPPGLGP